LALATFAAADDKKDEKKEEKKAAATPLEGSWKVVEASVDGKAESKEKLSDMVFTFEGGKMTAGAAEGKPHAGTFTVDAKQEPAHLDMVNPQGEKVAGIYKIDKDGKLTIAFPKARDTTRPKSFDGKGAVVLVLEKVKK
jgi:uncharacterized protein (TIGR03067 family)